MFYGYIQHCTVTLSLSTLIAEKVSTYKYLSECDKTNEWHYIYGILLSLDVALIFHLSGLKEAPNVIYLRLTPLLLF